MLATSPRSKRIRSRSFAGRPSASESERTVIGAASSAAVLSATGSARRWRKRIARLLALRGVRSVLAGALPVFPPVANGRCLAVPVLVFADKARRAGGFQPAFALALFAFFLLLDVFLQVLPQRAVGAEGVGREGDVGLLSGSLLFRCAPQGRSLVGGGGGDVGQRGLGLRFRPPLLLGLFAFDDRAARLHLADRRRAPPPAGRNVFFLADGRGRAARRLGRAIRRFVRTRSRAPQGASDRRGGNDGGDRGRLGRGRLACRRPPHGSPCTGGGSVSTSAGGRDFRCRNPVRSQRQAFRDRAPRAAGKRPA